MLERSMIAYATQRGTAAAAAQGFSEILHMPVSSVTDIHPADLKQYNKIVLVVSNYGHGEAPPQCEAFFEEFFAIKDPDYFNGVQFAVFGCGSSKKAPYYLTFTKNVEQKMIELGATKIAEMGFVDSNNPDKSAIETWPIQLKFDEL